MFRKRKEKKAVLEWVNEQRRFYNINGEVGPAGEPLRKLPRGDKGRARTCPIALALDARVDVISISLRNGAISTPVLIGQFIRDFDEGKYPELILRRA